MQFTVRGTPITVIPLMLIAIVLGLGIAGDGGYDYVQRSNAVDDTVAVERPARMPLGTSVTKIEI